MTAAGLSPDEVRSAVGTDSGIDSGIDIERGSIYEMNWSAPQAGSSRGFLGQVDQIRSVSFDRLRSRRPDLLADEPDPRPA